MCKINQALDAHRRAPQWILAVAPGRFDITYRLILIQARALIDTHYLCVCVLQEATCTTTCLSTACSARRRCVSMLLKSSWVWSTCTTASSSTETSRCVRPSSWPVHFYWVPPVAGCQRCLSHFSHSDSGKRFAWLHAATHTSGSCTFSKCFQQLFFFVFFSSRCCLPDSLLSISATGIAVSDGLLSPVRIGISTTWGPLVICKLLTLRPGYDLVVNDGYWLILAGFKPNSGRNWECAFGHIIC